MITICVTLSLTVSVTFGKVTHFFIWRLLFLSVSVKVSGHWHCMGAQHVLLGGTMMSLIKATGICLNLLGLLISEIACCSCLLNQNSLFLWSITTGRHLAMKSVPKMKSKWLCVHTWNSCVNCLFAMAKVIVACPLNCMFSLHTNVAVILSLLLCIVMLSSLHICLEIMLNLAPVSHSATISLCPIQIGKHICICGHLSMSMPAIYVG